MGENSKITWTHHTFNPFVGCSKVSPGCQKCYAERENIRYGRRDLWGPDATRQRTSEAYWKQPLKWNAAAEKAGQRKRVFCGSWCDVMEDAPGLQEIRRDLYSLICKTLSLDWLLLTKRPENFKRFLFPAWLENPWPNVWLGTTAEDQQRADERIPVLLQTPAAVRFVSCEPLLGPVDLARVDATDSGEQDALTGLVFCDGKNEPAETAHLDWVIVGGESGNGARPCNVEWIRSVVKRCLTAGAACFVKQLGAHPITPCLPCKGTGYAAGRDDTPGCGQCSCRGWVPLRTCDPKGADMAEFPPDLRVREMPEVSRAAE